jgi:hypothetical protein
MIIRPWYGCTTPDNADAYETLLKTRIFPGILARRCFRLNRPFVPAKAGTQCVGLRTGLPLEFTPD